MPGQLFERHITIVHIAQREGVAEELERGEEARAGWHVNVLLKAAHALEEGR